MTRILIVDDKEENLSYLQALLSAHGYAVDSAHNGTEALVRGRQTPPDLVVSDLLMPGMDGYTLLRHWKCDARLHLAPFIVYTATYTAPEDEHLALSLGADAFILKPAEPDEFMARLEKTLADIAAGGPIDPLCLPEDEGAHLDLYSQTLVRKLEEKTLQLEAANRALQQDIAERIRTEESLRLLGSAVEQAKDAIVITDAQLDLPGPRIIFSNPAFVRSSGYAAEDLIGATPRILQGPKTDRAVLAQLRGNLERGEIFEGEAINYRKDGTEYWQEWHITPIRDADGEITHYVAIQRDITERKRTQEALQNSEREQKELVKQLESERVRLIAAQAVAKIGSWETDFQTFSVTWSAEMYRIFQTTPEQFPATHAGFLDFVHPEDRERVEAAYLDSLSQPGPFLIEHRVLLPSGEVTYAEERWQVFYDGEGEHVKAVGTCQDITERKLAEEALRVREAEFHTLAEAMPQMVWMTRPDGWCTYYSQQWMDYTGLTLEESLGHEWSTPFHPDDRERARDAWRTATTTGENYSIECRLRRADGVYRWWLFRGKPLRDPSGGILKWLGTSTDIDELKRAHGHIEEQAALLDLARDAIFVRALDGRILYWSKGAETTYGWTAAEAAGRPVLELLRSDPAIIQEALDTVQATGTWNGEVQKLTKSDERLTCESRWTAMRDERGEIKSFLIIDTDVTERKRFEQQFFRAQRLESIGTLASGLAHDLNNILAPILMCAPLLRLGLPAEKTERLITTMESSAARGAQIISQVLTFGRGIEGERKPLQLAEIIDEILQIVRETFPKSIRVEKQVNGDLLEMVGDATQWHQVLLNLSVNARDAMPGGGVLRITAENLLVDAHYASMTAGLSEGPHIALEVSDSGTGIPLAIAERIFDPFFTTKAVGEGTGLGLSTVAGIVKSHGAVINLAHRPGGGTVFRIVLPAIGAQGMPATLPAPAPRVPAEGAATILIVDDEENLRIAASTVLELHGYQILLAADGTEALAIYAQHADEIDAVLTDIAMPFLDGVALIRAFQRMRPDLPIIASTGQNDRAVELKAIGIESILKKPYTAEHLRLTVEKALEAARSKGLRQVTPELAAG